MTDDDGDDASEERRLFEQRHEATVAFVASELGIARVELAGDRVGGFSLARQCTATAVGASGDTVAVGTDEDVLVSTGGEFVATGFGPATAVGVTDESVVAATPDGAVGRLDGPEFASSAWTTLDKVEEPRRFDGALLATGEGVYRLDAGLTRLGLDDVHDVATTADESNSGPFTATATGVYRHADGDWVRERDGSVQCVGAGDEYVHAVDGEGLLERDPETTDRAWHRRRLPDGVSLVDIAHGETLYGVTADGQVVLDVAPELTSDGQGGWGSQSVGLRGVVGLAVVDE